jgi:hypothetical protein
MTKDKLIAKQKEYIEWLEEICKIKYYAAPPIFKKEISSLEQGVDNDWVKIEEKYRKAWGGRLPNTRFADSKTLEDMIFNWFKNNFISEQEVEKESEHKLSVCSCGIPEPDIDRECCTICGKLIYD